MNNIEKLYHEYNIEYAEESANGTATFFDRNNGNKELTRKIHRRNRRKYVWFFGIEWNIK